jgi:hypothetical protein
MDYRPIQRSHDAIMAVATDVERRRDECLASASEVKKRFWCDEESGRLGVKVRTEVLVRCLQRASPVRHGNVTQIAETLFNRMNRQNELPKRGAGPRKPNAKEDGKGRAFWTKETFYNFLKDKDIAPTADDAERIVLTLADVVIHALSHVPDAADRLRSAIVEPRRSVEETAAAVLGSIDLGTRRAWEAPEGFDHWIDPNLLSKPHAVSVEALSKAAADTERFLRDMDGPRVVIISGSSYCGKKTTLRFFLSRAAGYRLKLTDETALPILAIALNDHTPDEFVDLVYRFYSAAHFSSLRIGRMAKISAAAKLERICEMAAVTPACVLLADVAPIDEDEIIRSLSRDYVGDVVLALLRGHPLTRLVLTTNGRRKHGFPWRETSRLCEHTEVVTIDTKLPLVCAGDFPQLMIGSADLLDDIKASGLTWRLAEIAMQLAKRRLGGSGEQLRFQRQAAVHLEQDDPPGLVALIWERLLSGEEHLLVGLIASSQDGLRVSVLRRMLLALRRLAASAWPSPPPSPQLLFERIAELRELVDSRAIHVDGPITQSGRSEQETLLSLDDAWRRLFLMQWCESDGTTSRIGHWFIAREATCQSRRLRLHDVESGSLVSFGRDVQSLHALIASVDPTAVVMGPDKANAHRQDCSDAPPPLLTAAMPHENLVEPQDNFESSILPPLEVDAPVPNARLVLRYVYLQLYRRDLEGQDYRLTTSLDDARTRLGILLPLFAPETPWLRVNDRSLARSFRRYGHLVAAFKPGELLELLANIAIAALRVQRFRLLSAAVRLGEEIFAEQRDAGISMMTYMRLLRAEIDAGLLLGGNPDALLPPSSETPEQASSRRPHDVQIMDVARRIHRLLDGPFALNNREKPSIDQLVARGKLLGRLGEAYHVAGYLGSSRNAFQQAVDIERNLGAEPVESSLAPVLGGRGVRSRLRFLIELAHRLSWDRVWSVFTFDDDLTLPVCRRVDRESLLLREAYELHHIETRRGSRGHVTDAIGLKIDGARLAALDHDFAEALRLLDLAASTKFASSSIEVLFELITVRTRLLIDAAILCLVANAKRLNDKVIFESQAEVEDIAHYLGHEAMQDPMALVESLLARARSSLKTLARLLTLHGAQRSPYGTEARYLDVLRRALESRRTRRTFRDTVAILDGARYQIEGALRHMKESGYGIHLAEARRLRDGLEAARAHYAKKAASCEI